MHRNSPRDKQKEIYNFENTNSTGFLVEFCLNIIRYMDYIRGDCMCDVKKYEKIYEEIEHLQPEDTLQLILEAETEEQRSFYEMVGDFLLQRKQRQVMERKSF